MKRIRYLLVGYFCALIYAGVTESQCNAGILDLPFVNVTVRNDVKLAVMPIVISHDMAQSLMPSGFVLGQVPLLPKDKYLVFLRYQKIRDSHAVVNGLELPNPFAKNFPECFLVVPRVHRTNNPSLESSFIMKFYELQLRPNLVNWFYNLPTELAHFSETAVSETEKKFKLSSFLSRALIVRGQFEIPEDSRARSQSPAFIENYRAISGIFGNPNITVPGDEDGRRYTTLTSAFVTSEPLEVGPLSFSVQTGTKFMDGRINPGKYSGEGLDKTAFGGFYLSGIIEETKPRRICDRTL